MREPARSYESRRDGSRAVNVTPPATDAFGPFGAPGRGSSDLTH
jgi:hypothetical protein